MESTHKQQRVRYASISQQPYPRLPYFNHHSYTLWAINLRLVPNWSWGKYLYEPHVSFENQTIFIEIQCFICKWWKIQPLKTAPTSSNQKYRLQSKFSHQFFFLNAFLASPVTGVTPSVSLWSTIFSDPSQLLEERALYSTAHVVEGVNDWNTSSPLPPEIHWLFILLRLGMTWHGLDWKISQVFLPLPNCPVPPRWIPSRPWHWRTWRLIYHG